MVIPFFYFQKLQKFLAIAMAYDKHPHIALSLLGPESEPNRIYVPNYFTQF